jgi:hypothetical protein
MIDKRSGCRNSLFHHILVKRVNNNHENQKSNQGKGSIRLRKLLTFVLINPQQQNFKNTSRTAIIYNQSAYRTCNL